MSKYAPLGTYLRKQDKNVVILTFGEIERILGAPLPSSAYRYGEWWANSGRHHSQARSWASAGYTVVSIQLGQNGFITFRKPGSGFWEKLLFGEGNN